MNTEEVVVNILEKFRKHNGYSEIDGASLKAILRTYIDAQYDSIFKNISLPSILSEEESFDNMSDVDFYNKHIDKQYDLMEEMIEVKIKELSWMGE